MCLQKMRRVNPWGSGTAMRERVFIIANSRPKARSYSEMLTIEERQAKAYPLHPDIYGRKDKPED